MTKFGWMVVLVVLLVVGGIAAFFLLGPAPAPAPAPVETGNENLEGQSIYASGEYGFTVRYPDSAKVSENFSNILPPNWRPNALEEATGTPLLQIVTYSTESDHSYPRSFHAFVRIGASSDPEALKACSQLRTDAGETALPDRVINGTTWKAFSYYDAAMMQYSKSVYYTTTHDGTCYALAQWARGSSYQDDPDSPDDVPQEKLDAEYAALDTIIGTFEFSR